MSDTIYGKGITVASGFDLGAKTPLDSRIVASTIEERDSHVSNNRAYDGMIVYVIEDKTTYQYLNGEWVIFGAEVIDNLASDSTIKGLSANQGRVLNEKIAEINTNINQNINESLVEVNKKIEEVGSEVDTLAGNIADELETIHGQLESVKDGIDYNDLLNKPTIPTRVTQLTNDANYTTKTYVDEKIASIGGSGGSGGGNASIYIGSTPPTDTNTIWADSSTPYTLEPNSYTERLKNNYLKTLNSATVKLLKAENSLSDIEEKINEISSDHATDATKLKTQLATVRSSMGRLKTRIEELITTINEVADVSPYKLNSKQLRKEVKELLYTLSDLYNSTMRIIDQEKGIVIENNGNEGGGNQGSADGMALLAENGMAIATEEGLLILLDGVQSSGVLIDSILTELGLPILTEDGRQILKG